MSSIASYRVRRYSSAEFELPLASPTYPAFVVCKATRFGARRQRANESKFCWASTAACALAGRTMIAMVNVNTVNTMPPRRIMAFGIRRVGNPPGRVVILERVRAVFEQHDRRIVLGGDRGHLPGDVIAWRGCLPPDPFPGRESRHRMRDQLFIGRV